MMNRYQESIRCLNLGGKKFMMLSVGLLALFAGHPPVCFAQSIFNSSVSEHAVALAEDGASRYLANDADFPERAVVLTEFSFRSIGDSGGYESNGMQFYVSDEKTKFRRIRSVGMHNGEEFEYESLWLDGKRWVFDDHDMWLPVYKSGSAQIDGPGYVERQWGSAGSMNVPLFDPRYVWTSSPDLLHLTLQTSLDDFIRPDAIKATRLNKRSNSVSALFATLTARGVTYMTEVTFPQTGMPEQFIRYAAMRGDFDLRKGKKAQEGFSPPVNKVKWVEFAPDRFVAIEASNVDSNGDESTDCKFSNRWLLGSAVPNWVFQDPRNNTVRLENLDLDKPVRYTK